MEELKNSFTIAEQSLSRTQFRQFANFWNFKRISQDFAALSKALLSEAKQQKKIGDVGHSSTSIMQWQDQMDKFLATVSKVFAELGPERANDLLKSMDLRSVSKEKLALADAIMKDIHDRYSEAGIAAPNISEGPKDQEDKIAPITWRKPENHSAKRKARRASTPGIVPYDDGDGTSYDYQYMLEYAKFAGWKGPVSRPVGRKPMLDVDNDDKDEDEDEDEDDSDDNVKDEGEGETDGHSEFDGNEAAEDDDDDSDFAP